MKFNAVTITILLGAAGLGYYFWNKTKKAAEKLKEEAAKAAAAAAGAAGAAGQILNQGSAGTGTPGAPAPGPNNSTVAGMISFNQEQRNKVLKIGSTGPEVRALQIFLAKTGLIVSIDGIYGNQTQTAVNSYVNQWNNLFIDDTFISRMNNKGGVMLSNFNIFNMDQTNSIVYGANKLPSLFSYEWTGNRLKGYDNTGKKWTP